jgi:hypothetical protein
MGCVKSEKTDEEIYYPLLVSMFKNYFDVLWEAGEEDVGDTFLIYAIETSEPDFIYLEDFSTNEFPLLEVTRLKYVPKVIFEIPKYVFVR